MSRPQKQGIDYFPYDTDLDQDDKLGMIIAEFGFKGENLFTKLLCWIYKNDGYFTVWKEDVQLRFLRRYAYCGFSMSFIKEVVPKLIKWGLFDQTVFDSFQILSSSRIQETWLDATRKRTIRYYIPKYWLLKVNAALTPEETGLNPEVINKVKEIKLKESEGEARPPATFSENLKTKKNNRRNFSAAENFIPPGLQEVKEFFKTDPEIPIFWLPAKREAEAGKYFNHYKGNGWLQGNGNPIIDWRAQARSWVKKDNSFSVGIKNNNSPPAVAQQGLSKIEKEINSLYEKYYADPEKFEITTIDPLDFNYLEKKGRINFLEDKRAEIQKRAEGYLRGKKIQIDDLVLMSCMKKFGIIEFFKEQLRQGREQIFKI